VNNVQLRGLPAFNGYSQLINIPNEASQVPSTNYTIVFDVKFPTIGGFVSLLDFNHDGDGELFISSNGGGIGINANYAGTVNQGTWYRIALSSYDVGGTNVLYLTAKDCPLDFLIYYNNRFGKDVKLRGLPALDEPIPITTKWAMGAVPFAFLGMGAVMSGLYWIINRRNKVGGENLTKEEEINQEDNDGEN